MDSSIYLKPDELQTWYLFAQITYMQISRNAIQFSFETQSLKTAKEVKYAFTDSRVTFSTYLVESSFSTKQLEI